MRHILTVVLFIVAAFSAGCGLLSKGGDGTDAPAPAKSDQPPAPAFDEAFCKESLQRCVETVLSSAKAYPTLNESRKLCPGLKDKPEIKFPVSDAEFAKIKVMATTGSCVDNLKACRDVRDRTVKTLSNGMKELSDCNPKQ